MDDIKPVNESSDEMELSPEDNDNSVNAFQDTSEESSKSPRTHGNQVSHSIPQNELENQQLSSGISAETSSRPSVQTTASTSQPLDIEQLDETAATRESGKVYYSSRKFWIRTKCSRSVDAVISNRQHSILFLMLYREESDKNSTTFENEVLPSVGQDPSQNQQLHSGISAEIYSRRLFTPASSSSQALDTNQLDDTFTNNGLFYSSRDLRIHTNCPQGIDAILSPRHNHKTTLQRLQHSDVNSIRIDRTARLPLKECRDTVSASSPQFSSARITRSLSKALNSPKTPTPSPEKREVEKDARVTSAKRKRTETPESDTEKSGIKTESLRSKLSPSTAARTFVKSPINLRLRETRSAARESEVFESVTRPLTPCKRKRERTESDSTDSNAADDAFISKLSKLNPPTSADKDDNKSSTKFQTHGSEVAERKFRKLAIEGKTSMSFRDASNDSNSATEHSHLEDLPRARSFIDLSEDGSETTIQSNIFIDISSGSPNKESGKRRKRSSPSNTWTVVPEEPGSLKLKLVPTDKVCSNLEPATSDTQQISSQLPIPKDCQPSKEFKKEPPIVSPEETQSASNITDSAPEQMLESSPTRPIIENFDFSKEVIDLGSETSEFITSPSDSESSSSQSHLSGHLPEQSSSTNINAPHLALDFKTNKEKEGNDNDPSDACNPMSEPNNDNLFDSNPNLGVLQKSALGITPEIQDPDVQRQENYSDPLLSGQVSSSISSGASISKQQTEMDLDPPYIDVCQGQPSTSSYQPVITDGSSGGDRLQSSSGVAATGEAMGRGTESNPSTKKISKYASNAQKLLLTVLQEVMELNEECHLYRKMRALFLGFTDLSCWERESVLRLELVLYIEQRKTAWFVQNLFVSRNVTTEYLIQEAYEDLVIQVILALASTVSQRTSLEFKTIMDSYNSVKGVYERCSQFWSNDHKDIQDEVSRIRVLGLKRMTQRLFLQTRNAFRELLMHIGEHAEEEIINSFEENLWEEDKSFLRRSFNFSRKFP